MLPPDQVNGYQYPLPVTNPSGAPNNAYAAPPKGMMGYGGTSSGASAAVPTTKVGDPYSPSLTNPFNGPDDTLSNAIPDPMRLGEFPARTMFPNAGEPPSNFYLGAHGTNRDQIQRHSVEAINEVGWTSPPGPGGSANQWAPNPRFNAYPEGGSVSGFSPGAPDTVRPTARMSQNTYSFTRPFDQNYARRLNGSHFSMADHRRTYPVFTMRPPPTWRNTSRVDPPPWDANIVDTPNGPNTVLAPAIPNYEAPMNSQQFVFGG